MKRQLSELITLSLVVGLAFAFTCDVHASEPSDRAADLARWAKEAKDVTIIRDDWGIAHVSGKTDADAVFGVIYAEAEDDFERVESNYLDSLGRRAEAEGESKVIEDLRMKMFIDPQQLKQLYEESPEWLKQLMNAWADGLNFYLAEHPEVKPLVIRKFERWMSLSFTEGSIGGDIERVSLQNLSDFYDRGPTGGYFRRKVTERPEGTSGVGVRETIGGGTPRLQWLCDSTFKYCRPSRSSFNQSTYVVLLSV